MGALKKVNTLESWWKILLTSSVRRSRKFVANTKAGFSVSDGVEVMLIVAFEI